MAWTRQVAPGRPRLAADQRFGRFVKHAWLTLVSLVVLCERACLSWHVEAGGWVREGGSGAAAGWPPGVAVGLLRDVFPRRLRRRRSERVRASCSEETVPSAQKRRARIHSDPPSARHDEVRHAQPRQSSARHGEAAPAAQPAPTRPLWRGAARSLRLPIAPSQDSLRRDVARPPQSPARTEKTFFGEAWRDRPGGPECPAKTAIGEARRGGPGGPARPAETVVGEAWRGCSGGPARPAKTVLGETRQDSPGCPARPATTTFGEA